MVVALEGGVRVNERMGQEESLLTVTVFVTRFPEASTASPMSGWPGPSGRVWMAESGEQVTPGWSSSQIQRTQ